MRLPCAICGMPIDYDLPAGDPMSFEVDEIARATSERETKSVTHASKAIT